MTDHGPVEVVSLFEDLLKEGSDIRVRVTGRSMVPYLAGGEILTIRQEPSASLRPGDLILFRNRYDLPILHRIIRKRTVHDGTLFFLTKGDASKAFDEEIPEYSVLGKVCRIEKISAAGRIRIHEMDSFFHRGVNFIIALPAVFKTRSYTFLTGLITKRS